MIFRLPERRHDHLLTETLSTETPEPLIPKWRALSIGSLSSRLHRLLLAERYSKPSTPNTLQVHSDAIVDYRNRTEKIAILHETGRIAAILILWSTAFSIRHGGDSIDILIV